MAFPNVTVSNANKRAASIKAAFIRSSAPNSVFYTMGGLGKSSLSFDPVSEDDSQGRNKANAMKKFKANIVMLQSAKAELDLLPSICALGENDFLFQLVDSEAVGETNTDPLEGWVLVLGSTVNCNPGTDLSGISETKRHIPLEFTGILTDAEYLAAIAPVLATESDFASTADAGAYKAMGVYTAAKDGGKPNQAHNATNGVLKIEVAAHGGALVNLGAPINFKAPIKFVSNPEEDQFGRHDPILVDLPIEYDVPITDGATLLLLPSMTAAAVDAKITMKSGLVVTTSDAVGIEGGYVVGEDNSKRKVLHFKHGGKIPVSAFTGLLSGV